METIAMMKKGITLLALSGLLLTPTFGFCQGKGKGEKEHWNPAPPKKNGRHDNRDWNKSNKQAIVLKAPASKIEAERRQDSKNEWRNIAIMSGAVALIGALKNDKTLMFVGAAGALYSLYRYEEDRKSQDQLARLRASYFSREYFYRDGVRYNRKLVVKDGKKYYQFCKAS